jgi:hypothetical protein
VQEDIIDTRIKRSITLRYPMLYGIFLRECTNLHRSNNCSIGPKMIQIELIIPQKKVNNFIPLIE